MQRTIGALAVAVLLAAVGVQTQAAAIPTPESVLGYRVGADYKLATYDDALGYFRKLAAASDRIRLVQVEGKTSYGHDWYYAIVSSPDNLKNLEKYRGISQRLAHPQGLTDAEAHQLAREGKAIVHIDGGLHATEVAGPQHTMQLAYDILSRADDPAIAPILDNVIFILWPTINPDGQNIVANWYRSNVGTPYEVAPLPELYQRYIGHDNNRDAYMLNMIESREIERTWRHWEPQIVYVHHQSAPFPTRIWLPPFAEPIAPEVPPLMSRTVNMIGMAIAEGLEEHGQPGATHMGTGFDAWYPGYIDYMPMLQNENAFWTETALYRYATPHFYTLNDFPPGDRSLRSESLYPSPWTGGWWRLRDAVEYMETASLSVLDYAAKYRESLLYNRYQAGRDQIRKYEHEPPYAYLVPQQQRDPVAAVELLRRLAFDGIRVSQLTTAARHDGLTYPAGTWVIPMNQEFADLAKQLLEVQHYPDLREFPDGPPEQPYDAAGWTLPYQMDVRVVEARQPLTEAFKKAMAPLGSPEPPAGAGVDDATFDSVAAPGFDSNPVAHAIVPPAGGVTGTGPALAVDPAQNNAFRAVNAAWNAGATVRFAGGRYIIDGASAAFVDGQVQSLALRAERVAAAGTVLKRPRLALYQPWTANMDTGWTTWLLERYGFTFTPLHNADVQSGSLRDRYDVILIADDRPRSLMEGFAEGTVPPRYAGGLGAEGVRALDAFVRNGGTLVCLNNSSVFAIDQLHLPVRNVVAGLKRQQFFASGSLLEVIPDTTHPVMAGMPPRASIFFDDSPVFAPADGFAGDILAKYQTAGSPLMSGYLLGESHLHGMAAAVDVKHGDGHVVLIGFRPQWRGQPFGTFRVLFNAALFSRPAADANPSH
ncbi:MAG TPA: M14 metallopeptidase family protein [Vicinamibacterales bacterium]|nr:M14 metallopeptidase family protein [Vicinamibacterales bacterium]